jgi:hypothetical protein
MASARAQRMLVPLHHACLCPASQLLATSANKVNIAASASSAYPKLVDAPLPNKSTNVQLLQLSSAEYPAQCLALQRTGALMLLIHDNDAITCNHLQAAAYMIVCLDINMWVSPSAAARIRGPYTNTPADKNELLQVRTHSTGHANMAT